MKLEKAIRRLQGFVRWRKPDPDDCFVESVQLGIEALKRFDDFRHRGRIFDTSFLSGETEE